MHQGQKRLMCFDWDERSRSGSRGEVGGVGGVSLCQAALDAALTQVLRISASLFSFLAFLFFVFAGRLSMKDFFSTLFLFLFLSLVGLRRAQCENQRGRLPRCWYRSSLNILASGLKMSRPRQDEVKKERKKNNKKNDCRFV